VLWGLFWSDLILSLRQVESFDEVEAGLQTRLNQSQRFGRSRGGLRARVGSRTEPM
jgi:hypothetical protein